MTARGRGPSFRGLLYVCSVAGWVGVENRNEGGAGL